MYFIFQFVYHPTQNPTDFRFQTKQTIFSSNHVPIKNFPIKINPNQNTNLVSFVKAITKLKTF